MKNKILILSIFLNLIIITIVLYFLSSSSISASMEDEIEDVKSIQKINLTGSKIFELSPELYKKKIFELSKNKKCVVVFWASWCKYCPDLLKTILTINKNKDYDFNFLCLSIDKPNEKGKNALLKKAVKLNISDSIFIVSENIITDISNTKSIYNYLPIGSNFDSLPGFPHIIIFDKNRVVYEDTGFDNVYGLSKYVHLLK